MLKNVAILGSGLMVGLMFMLGAQPEPISSPAAPNLEEVGALYLPSDLFNDSAFTVDDRRILREGALNVLKSEPNCGKVVYGDRSTSREGTYFVMCEPKDGGGAFNVFFTPQDLRQNGTISVGTSYPEQQAKAACERAITANVAHPSTLKFSRLLGFSTTVHNNGRRTIIQEFTAKNAFGLELKHSARCLILPDGATEVTIAELS